jgi:hypothetical protein
VWKRGKDFVAFALAHEWRVVSKWRFVGTEENFVDRVVVSVETRFRSQASTVNPNSYASFLHRELLSRASENFARACDRRQQKIIVRVGTRVLVSEKLQR